MQIDCSKIGNVVISIIKYIGNIFVKLPNKMIIVYTAPESKYFFDVNDNPEKLDYLKAQIFHPIVAKISFPCKSDRSDILTVSIIGNKN